MANPSRDPAAPSDPADMSCLDCGGSTLSLFGCLCWDNDNAWDEPGEYCEMCGLAVCECWFDDAESEFLQPNPCIDCQGTRLATERPGETGLCGTCRGTEARHG